MERLSELNVEDVANEYKLKNLFDQSNEFTGTYRSYLYIRATHSLRKKSKIANVLMLDMLNSLGLKSFLSDIQFIEQDFKYSGPNGIHFLLIKFNRSITLCHIQQMFLSTKNNKKLFSSSLIILFQDDRFENRVADKHFYDWLNQQKNMTIEDKLNPDCIKDKEVLAMNEHSKKDDDKIAETVYSKDTMALLSDYIRAFYNNTGEYPQAQPMKGEIKHRISMLENNFVNENSTGVVSSVFDQSKKIQSAMSHKRDFYEEVIKKAPDDIKAEFYDTERFKKTPQFGDAMSKNEKKDQGTKQNSVTEKPSIKNKSKSE